MTLWEIEYQLPKIPLGKQGSQLNSAFRITDTICSSLLKGPLSYLLLLLLGVSRQAVS